MAERGFPARAGNRFQLLVDGPVFSPQMLAAIRGAGSYVMMEMYLVDSGDIASRFCSAFIDAARRGVTIQLLLDAFGSRTLGRQDRERLRQGGVQLVFYNPRRLRRLKRNLQRTHRKYLVIDGAVAYVGGWGSLMISPGRPAGARPCLRRAVPWSWIGRRCLRAPGRTGHRSRYRSQENCAVCKMARAVGSPGRKAAARSRRSSGYC